MENQTCKAVLHSCKANYSLARRENYYKISQGFSNEISEQLALCFLFYNRIPLFLHQNRKNFKKDNLPSTHYSITRTILFVILFD